MSGFFFLSQGRAPPHKQQANRWLVHQQLLRWWGRVVRLRHLPTNVYSSLDQRVTLTPTTYLLHKEPGLLSLPLPEGTITYTESLGLALPCRDILIRPSRNVSFFVGCPSYLY
uniref:Uncharacterized protein n=2 Tax=Picea TaxID=3328 RepID=A0A101M4Z1_PICGL|nr:hypothetical protein ABT39_MTgene1027 [Picea glauca]QHR90052.1 hypothetical protein Q903MT_gene4075 [Picea sitchensis]